MDIKKKNYEGFLNTVDPDYREFVNQTHDFFKENECKIKIAPAKSGYVVSYSDAVTKKVVSNYVFRNIGMLIRIYGENSDKYMDLFNELPENMIEGIKKASDCKRLIDPKACNSRCSMGYDFIIGDTRYQKCRNNSFMFEVNNENIPFISRFLENEVKERMAVQI